MASLSDLSVASNQIAQQNNPEYAALNQIVQSRVMPYEGFGKFVQETLEPEKKRQHDKDLLGQQYKYNKKLNDDAAKRDADKYRRKLEDMYLLQYGGLRDVKTMDNDALRIAINARQQQQLVKNPYTASPTSTVSYENGQYTIPTMPQSGGIYDTNARMSNLDNAPLNKSGRLVVRDLYNANKIYPYLSQTNKGREFLARLETAIETNPDDPRALLPFLKELQTGNIPLTPEIRDYDNTPYKELKTHEELVEKAVENDVFGSIPTSAFGRFVASGTRLGAEDAEREAMKYGYVPKRQKEVEGDGIFDNIKRWFSNRKRYSAANEYMENFEPTYDFMMEKDIRPIQTPPTDQYTSAIKATIAKSLGLPSRNLVQAGIDPEGNLIFVANGQLFTVDDNGFVYRMEQ